MAVVFHYLIEIHIQWNAYAMARSYAHDSNCVIPQHAVEVPLCGSKNKRFVKIIPVHRNDRSGAVLVGIAVSTVFVKLEVRIFAAVDTNQEGILNFGRSLYYRPQRNNASGPDQDGQAVKGSIAGNRSTSPILLTGPEVYPCLLYTSRCE